MKFITRLILLSSAITMLSAAVTYKALMPMPNPAGATKNRDAAVFHLSDKDIATIYIHSGGSVLSFPVKPTKVIIGREGQFDVQYIERDVAVVALSSAASASMFVYMLGRRYTFNLVASEVKGERIIVIRDSDEDRVEVEVK